MKISIILPTYNERDNIVELIQQLQDCLGSYLSGFEWEIIVVDDDSPDGTVKAVKGQFGESSLIRVFVRTGERGLGTAIKYGIEKSTGDRIIVMDTDFQHEPKQIREMAKFLEYYDIIVGSRFTTGGGMEDEVRYYLSFAFNFFLRVILMMQIQDSLSGYFSIRREKLFELHLDRIFCGFGDYFMRLLYAARKRKFRILEIPVWYPRRPAGQRKSQFVKMLVTYTASALSLRLGRHP